MEGRDDVSSVSGLVRAKRGELNAHRRLLVKVRAAQVKAAARTIQLAAVLLELRRAIGTETRSIRTWLAGRVTADILSLCRERWTRRRLLHQQTIHQNYSRRHSLRLASSTYATFAPAAARSSLDKGRLLLQQSAVMSHIPNRRQLRRYLPRSVRLIVPCWIATA